MLFDAMTLPKPFCRLEEAAFFLDLTFNQAQVLWERETLPRAVAQDGSEWQPGGRRLVRVKALHEMLDPEGRALLEKWQRDEIRIGGSAASGANRTVPVRHLGLKNLAPHGTTARYRTCKCEECRAAHSRYMRAYKSRQKGSS
jgi:hypothetical protein